MSRKTVTIDIDDQDSRDFGKKFIITEMSAWDGEELAQDITRIMGDVGFSEIPQDVINMGSAGLATLGLSFLSAAHKEVSGEIKKRLMQTVQVVNTDDKGKVNTSPVNQRLDFEEITTIRRILDEVFKLNFSFFFNRRRVEYPFINQDEPPSQLITPVNVSSAIHAVMSAGKASYFELTNGLSIRDLYNILESIAVDNYNQLVWQRHGEKK